MTSDNETFEAWLDKALDDSGHQYPEGGAFCEGARASRSYHLELIKELVDLNSLTEARYFLMRLVNYQCMFSQNS